MKRTLGVILLILGVALLLTSYYINNRVMEGKQKIKSTEKNVETGKNILSLNPVSKEVGKQLTKGVDEKIEQGKTQVTYYSNIAYWIKVTGIIFIVLGIILVLFGKKKVTLPPQ